MSNTKHIIATNVILALLIRFSTQFNNNLSDTTYQNINDWSIETNLLDFDESNEELMAFSEFILFCNSYSLSA